MTCGCIGVIVIRTVQSRLMERLQAICMEIEKHNCSMWRDMIYRFAFRLPPLNASDASDRYEVSR